MLGGRPHLAMGQHPAGVRVEVDGHMCPECGVFTRPLCPVCLGLGVIPTDRLGRWQTEQNRLMNEATP